MKKLFILPLLLFTFGCIVDETESEDDLSGCQTFLECAAGKYFTYLDDDEMIKFSNDPTGIWMEFWDYGDSCFEYANNLIEQELSENEEYQFNLISNEKDFIVIRTLYYRSGNNQYYNENVVKVSLTADGNLLWEYYDDLSLTGTPDSYVFNLLDDSTVDEVLSLENCNNTDVQTSAQEIQDDVIENEPTYFGNWTLHKIYDQYGEEYIISDSYSKKELIISEEQFGTGPSAYDFTYRFTFETCDGCNSFPLPIDNYLGGLYPTVGDILSFVQLWNMPNKLANNANFYLPDYNSLILEFENGNTDPDDPKGYTMFFYRNGRPKSAELDSAIDTFLSNVGANQVSNNNNQNDLIEGNTISILDGVTRITCGENTVPGTIKIDNCDWKPVFSDNRGNIAAAFNEEYQTLLIGAGGYFLDDGYNDTNDNKIFIENLLGSNKKGLFYMGINLDDSRLQPYQNHMSSLGNTGFIYLADSPLNETIAGLRSGDNELSDYDYLIFNPEDNRLNSTDISLIRSFIENPNKVTVLIGMGWVWASYYRDTQSEQMPLNLLLDPYGVEFVTDGNSPDHYTYDIYNEVIYYPNTYSTKTDYFNCSLED